MPVMVFPKPNKKIHCVSSKASVLSKNLVLKTDLLYYKIRSCLAGNITFFL